MNNSKNTLLNSPDSAESLSLMQKLSPLAKTENLADDQENNLLEAWASVSFAPGYEISSFGRVRSLWDTFGRKRIHYLKWVYQGRGYPMVSLNRATSGPKNKTFLVHRLVALAFVKGQAVGLQVNHKDGNKNNPRAENLEWVTRSENARHGVSVLGTVGKRKLTPVQREQIRRKFFEDKRSKTSLAIEYGCCPANILALVRAKSKIAQFGSALPPAKCLAG